MAPASPTLETAATLTALTTEPWVESPFVDQILAEGGYDPQVADLARRYHRDGYLILPDVLSADDADEVRTEAAGFGGPPPPGSDARRLQDLWQHCPGTRALACHQGILDLLGLLYGRPAFPFQTLTFPVGTQQRNHSDTVHFSSLPARFMCGVWVALEDIEADMGPLFYYPGSHRLPEYTLYDLWQTVQTRNYSAYEDALEQIVTAAGLEQHTLCVPKGTALVWSSNLIHGGSPVLRDGVSRWSQVTHYFFDGCIYYTPMFSNPIAGQYALREPVDIATGQVRANSWNGVPVAAHPIGDGRSIIDFGAP